ncbi:MAG: hypothetical protein LBQ81_13230 [Zoogloeaceae bacterium]|nr:hypothetical protein [Zoogloeaceae bacterium]
MEVEDFHTYYVGTCGVWVHNAGCTETAKILAKLGLDSGKQIPVYAKNEIIGNRSRLIPVRMDCGERSKSHQNQEK